MTAAQGQGLLDTAMSTGDRKLARLVEKVRGLLAEIRAELDEFEGKKAVREKVARLEKELAAAKAELNKGRKPATGGRANRLRDEVRAEIVKRYVAGEKPTRLATALGVGTASVYRSLREAGIELRGHSR